MHAQAQLRDDLNLVSAELLSEGKLTKYQNLSEVAIVMIVNGLNDAQHWLHPILALLKEFQAQQLRQRLDIMLLSNRVQKIQSTKSCWFMFGSNIMLLSNCVQKYTISQELLVYVWLLGGDVRIRFR